MGLLSKVFSWRRRDKERGAVTATRNVGPRICRFEQIERREFLNGAPVLQLGAVYDDAHSGLDVTPNTFTVTWSGGAAGTELKQLTISTDLNGNPVAQMGDPFFNTGPGSPGAYGTNPLAIASHNGFDVSGQNPANGSTILTLNFNGFTAGKQLVFTIDLDDMGPHGADATVNGLEFQGSKLIGLFSAPHYQDFTATGTFYDVFNPAEQASGLPLPADNYIGGLIGGTTVNNIDQSVYTAGAFASGQQTPLPITLEGDVYYDSDLDNVPQPGDPGLGGVQLSLLVNDNGTFVPTGQTTTTDANGHYKFTGVLPGDYQVVETQPTGYFAVGSSPGSFGGASYGIAVNPNLLSQIDVLGGEDVTNLDFSQSLPDSIAGTVRVPPVGNCTTDPTAPGLGGVTIQLLDTQGNVLQTATTAADGTYKFTNLRAGHYTVHELLPAGYYAVDADLGTVNGVNDGTTVDLQTTSNIVLTSAQTGVQYDFCLQQPVSITGTVRVPPVGNCTTDPTAPPLGGVTIQLLDSQGNVLQTTTTAADGTYAFKNLHVGSYTVHELLPSGYYAVDADLGTVNGATDGTTVNLQTTSNIVLTSGQNGVQYDFCLQQPVSITGTVRVPPVGNCTTDPTAPPLGGVTIQLLDSQGNVLQTTTTAADGTYAFKNLHVGTYTVHELLPSGYYAVDADLGTVNGATDGTTVDLQTTSNIVLTSGQNGVQYDFCLQQPVSITGTVRVPPVGNCTTDPTAPPLGGVTIQLLDSQGNVLQTTTTAADGTYAFKNLHVGTYTVHELLPSGYYAVDADLGTVNGVSDGTTVDLQTTSSIALTSGQNGVQYDFCLQQPVSIAGTVRVPPVGDCTTDPTAPGLGGVTVQLLDGNGNVLQTTTTAGDGTYSFKNLQAGTYTVHELPPAGYYAVDADMGTVNGVNDGTTVDLQTTSNVVLTSGQNGVQYDFCLQQPVNIAGTVRVPPVGNCTTDPTAPGLGGVTVQLLDGGGNVLRTTTTAADGTYSFTNLHAGAYTVHELLPAGYYAEDADLGTVNGANDGTTVNLQTTSNIVLTSGQNGIQYDFCLQQPVSISGVVKNAIYGDCETAPSDPPVSGVTIQLLDAQGNVIGTTTTNAAGIYSFDNLQPGTYGVHELLPQGFLDADSHVGSAGGQITGQDLITSVSLTSGASGTGYNFCLLPGGSISGYVFQDGPAIETKNVAQDLPGILATLPTIRDGVRRPGDAPIAGVTLELADATGVLLLDQHGNPIQAVTDAHGYYQFTNLPQGLYTVVEVPPGGYVMGVNTAGSLGGLAINPTLISVGAESLGVSASDALLQAVGTNDAIASIPLGAGQSSINNNFSVVLVVQEQIPTPPPPTPPPPVAFVIPLQLPPSVPGPPPAAPPVLAPPIYASARVTGMTWHLSVVDAGWPRGDRRGNEALMRLTRARSTNISWNNAGLRDSLWTMKGEPNDRNEPANAIFGMRGAIPVTGDFNGDGTTEIGVFMDGEWFLDLNGNGVWDEGDLWAKLGSAGDRPVTGDWDGDGKTDIGIFGPAWPRDPRAVATEPGLPHPENFPTGAHKNMPPERDNATLGWRTIKRTRDGVPREDLIDHVFHYGTPGDFPIAGDWTGTGVDTIGVFRDGQFILDVDGDGKRGEKDLTVHLGRRGDRPVVGDFDGDGVDELGVYRDGVWLVDINHDGSFDERDLRHELGAAGDTPVVGDWNGDGVDQIGTHQQTAVPVGEL